MKLKNNKKTGDIIDSKDLLTDEVIKDLFSKDFKYFDSKLANIQRMWEDYEEPKDFWFIDDEGDVEVEDEEYEEHLDEMKSIGNYFETEKEAEKAVEKLKALTEAKEDGLKIKGYYYNHEDLVILADIGKCNKLTLDTLFGKEID